MEVFLLLVPLPGERRPGSAVRLAPPCRLAPRTFRWSLETGLQAQLILPNPMAVPGGDTGRKGESESTGTLHFLYVSRSCCSGEKRLEQDPFCLQLLREEKKRKSTNLITSLEHVLHREKRMFEL